MRRRALALLAILLVLSGCGGAASNYNDQKPAPRYRPNSNQNPGYDGSG